MPGFEPESLPVLESFNRYAAPWAHSHVISAWDGEGGNGTSQTQSPSFSINVFLSDRKRPPFESHVMV